MGPVKRHALRPSHHARQGGAWSNPLGTSSRSVLGKSTLPAEGKQGRRGPLSDRGLKSLRAGRAPIDPSLPSAPDSEGKTSGKKNKPDTLTCSSREKVEPEKEGTAKACREAWAPGGHRQHLQRKPNNYKYLRPPWIKAWHWGSRTRQQGSGPKIQHGHLSSISYKKRRWRKNEPANDRRPTQKAATAEKY